MSSRRRVSATLRPASPVLWTGNSAITRSLKWPTGCAWAVPTITRTGELLAEAVLEREHVEVAPLSSSTSTE